MHYSEATKTREVWAKSLLDEFKSTMEMLKSAARDQQGPGSGRSSPQHGNRSFYSCITSQSTDQHVQMYFCRSVSLKEDVNEPLASQEREGGGVGLREADGGLLGRSPHTQPPVQCCWCLEPGTAVCVRTAGCGGAHLLSRHIGFPVE